MLNASTAFSILETASSTNGWVSEFLHNCAFSILEIASSTNGWVSEFLHYCAFSIFESESSTNVFITTFLLMKLPYWEKNEAKSKYFIRKLYKFTNH